MPPGSDLINAATAAADPRRSAPWVGNVVYAVRTALAAVAALYVAMWLELDVPRWAMWTVIVVSPPARGDILRKTVSRAIGTPIGCVAAVALAAAFPQDPLGYTVGLAFWIGLCGWWATFRRDYVAYAAVLAGFTAAIVAGDAANQPQAVFDTAISRGSATMLGVMFALVAAAVPSRTDDVPAELADQFGDLAARLFGWAADLIGPDARPADDAPFAPPTLDVESTILNAVAERPALRRVRPWVAGWPTALLSLQSVALQLARDGGGADGERVRSALLRCRGLVRQGASARLAALRSEQYRLADERLSDLSARDAVAAAAAVVGGIEAALSLRPPTAAATHPYPSPAFINDWDKATATFVRAVVGLAAAYLVWNATAWASGPAFLANVAVALVIVVAGEDPFTGLRYFFRGNAIGVTVGLLSQYLLLPMSSNFEWLSAVFVPLIAAGAWAQTFAPTAGLALGYGNGLVVGLDPTNPQRYDLAASVNGAITVLLGTAFASLLYVTIGPVPRGRHRARVVLGRMADAIDVARRLGPGTGRDRRLAWETRMFDDLRRVRSASGDPADRRAAVDHLLAGRAAFDRPAAPAGGPGRHRHSSEADRVLAPAP